MSTLLIFLGVFFGLALFCRVPIAYSLGMGAIVGFLYNGLSLMTVGQAAFNGLQSLPFLAVPFFILAGTFMEHSGISRQLLEFIEAFFGRFRGAAGTIAVFTSAAFGAITGSVLATISAVGKIVFPTLIEKGYSKEYSAALLTASSILGILVPPSVPGIIYSLASGVKVSDVWFATLGPALLLCVAYSVLNFVIVGRREEKGLRITAGEYTKNIVRKSGRAIPALLMPVIIFGGIYSGMFTATEAGSVAVVYGTLYYLYKKLRKMKATSTFYKIVVDSATVTASIGMLIVFATVTSRLIAFSGVSALLANIITEGITSPLMFIVLVNVLFIVLGTFMDENAAIMIFIPLLVPTVAAYGIDPVYFSGMALLNLSIGFMTPPFATALFLGIKIADADFIGTAKWIIPFFLTAVAVLIIVVLCPAVTTYLPGLITVK